jgi:hypothetical protein
VVGEVLVDVVDDRGQLPYRQGSPQAPLQDPFLAIVRRRQGREQEVQSPGEAALLVRRTRLAQEVGDEFGAASTASSSASTNSPSRHRPRTAWAGATPTASRCASSGPSGPGTSPSGSWAHRCASATRSAKRPSVARHSASTSPAEPAGRHGAGLGLRQPQRSGRGGGSAAPNRRRAGSSPRQSIATR